MVDFKLCHSQKDSHRAQRKVESSSSEVKIVQIVAEMRKIFPSQLEKGTSGLYFFALEGKIYSNFGEKTALQYITSILHF